MKFSITLLLALFLFACGNSTKNSVETENKDESTVTKSEKIKSDKAMNCDDFIKRYDEWTDAYLDVLEKYMKNPLDATMSEKYMKLAEESMNWYQQWEKLMVCSTKEKYQKKFDAIAEKVDKRMEELGLN